MHSNWLSIAEDSDEFFRDATISRGVDYFEEGRVRLLEIGETTISANVRGTRVYQVDVEAKGTDIEDLGDLLWNCSCPAAQRAPCKHLYATLCAAEDLALGYDTTHFGGIARTTTSTTPPWRHQLSRLHRPAKRDPWANVLAFHAKLHIVLCLDSTIISGVPVVRLMFHSRLKNGDWSVPKDLRPNQRLPRFDEKSRALFDLASKSEAEYVQDTFGYPMRQEQYNRKRLLGPHTKDSLIEFARSGVLHFGQSSGRAEDNPVAFDSGGRFEFAMKLEGDEKTGARLDGLLRRGDRTVDLCEPDLILECGLMVMDDALVEVAYHGAWSWAEQLRATGAIETAAEGYSELVAILLEHGREIPMEGEFPRLVETTATGEAAPIAQGVLQIHTKIRDAEVGRHRYHSQPDKVPAEVGFRYGAGVIDAKSSAVVCLDPNSNTVAPRDFARESALLTRLLELGATEDNGDGDHTAMLPEQRAIHIGMILQSEGWEVTTNGQQWRSSEGFHLRVSTGIDWFELEGDLQFGEHVVAIPEILAALRAGKRAITLKDGSLGLLPDDLAERLGLLTDFGQQHPDGLRFSKNQGLVLDALLEEQSAEVAADSEFRALGRRAAKFRGVQPRNATANFQGELRPYQCDALGWFRFLQMMHLGGCLADDMGLGKTVMVLAQLLHHRRATKKEHRKPSIVVAPKSLVWNWIEEATRFAPSLTVLDYSGSASERNPELIADHDLVVTTYGVLRRDADKLRDVPLAYAILDEAQSIKNPASQTWKAARLLQADHRLALTGTPVENHLGDLWAIMEFLNPAMLGPRSTYKLWATERDESAALRNRVARVVRPVLLRRTKENVLKELPARQETLLHCEMGSKQRKTYTDLRNHYRDQLLGRIDADGMARSKMHVLEALLRLRQVACHPALLDGERAMQPCAKFDALLPRLAEIKESGRKALVFSQFTSLLSLLKTQLDSEDIAYTYLDGKSRKRNEIVRAFQDDPDLPLFLISLKAGGVGLNLTAADHVFILDPWWNPAVERQAVDRAHRIGQTKVVNVYRLITSNTVEQRIMELQERKRELAEAIVGTDSGLLKKLTRDDLAALLDG